MQVVCFRLVVVVFSILKNLIDYIYCGIFYVKLPIVLLVT